MSDSVIEIDDNAFSNCEKLKEIKFSNNIYRIGNGAFTNTNLSKILLPDLLTIIDNDAFKLSNLTEIKIPTITSYIGNNAFSDCNKLESAYMFDETILLNPGIFSGCTYLKHCKLSNNLKSIPSGMFYKCYNLKKLECNTDEITYIGAESFFKCKYLSNFKLPNKLTQIKEYTFKDCRELNFRKMPENLITISSGAFDGCENLIDIEIPQSVKVIEDGVFSNCKNLCSIEIHNIEKISPTAFTDVGLLSELDEGVIMYVDPNTYAYNYAINNPLVKCEFSSDEDYEKYENKNTLFEMMGGIFTISNSCFCVKNPTLLKTEETPYGKYLDLTDFNNPKLPIAFKITPELIDMGITKIKLPNSIISVSLLQNQIIDKNGNSIYDEKDSKITFSVKKDSPAEQYFKNIGYTGYETYTE